MDYVEQWEKMKADIRRREKENKHITIHLRNNPYGFKINRMHPLVKPKWQAYLNSLGGSVMTDELRREFEKQFMNSKYYQKCIEQEKQKYGAAYSFINLKANKKEN